VVLSDVVLPDGLTAIGECGFARCSALTAVVLPDTLFFLGDGAFQHCEAITHVRLPEYLTELGNEVFLQCSSLAAVVLPRRLQKIGQGTFRECSGLEEVVFPETLTEIGSECFRGCTRLRAVRLHKRVEIIGTYAFCDCSGLAELRLPATVGNLGSSAFKGSTQQLRMLVVVDKGVEKSLAQCSKPACTVRQTVSGRADTVRTLGGHGDETYCSALAATAKPSSLIQVGSTATIAGVTTHVALNGLIGVVIGPDSRKRVGWWNVKLPKKRPGRLRRACAFTFRVFPLSSASRSFADPVSATTPRGRGAECAPYPHTCMLLSPLGGAFKL
jgi:hypothetical protein